MFFKIERVCNGESSEARAVKRKLEELALQGEPGNKLFIGNLPKGCREDHLYRAFKRLGNVNHVHIVKTEDGDCKGFGFVTFSTEDEAAEAIKYDGKLQSGIYRDYNFIQITKIGLATRSKIEMHSKNQAW